MTGYLQGAYLQMQQLTETCEVLISVTHIILYNYVYPLNLTYLQRKTGIPVTYIGTYLQFHVSCTSGNVEVI
jgi:hypothetical protein